jgi:hypothetical protein
MTTIEQQQTQQEDEAIREVFRHLQELMDADEDLKTKDELQGKEIEEEEEDEEEDEEEWDEEEEEEWDEEEEEEWDEEDEEEYYEVEEEEDTILQDRIVNCTRGHWCPASLLNLQHSVRGHEEGLWAYSEHHPHMGKWRSMEIGDMVMFGHRKHGCRDFGFVTSKHLITDAEDTWPDRQKNGKAWRYGYRMDVFLLENNIYQQMKEDVLKMVIIGKNNHCVQTQNLLKNGRLEVAKAILLENI